MALTSPAVAALRELFGDRLSTDPAEVDPYRRDASHLVGSALAVVRPIDADEIVAVVRWARTHRIPLVPRGAGTSLDGESVPFSAVVVDLSGWNRVLEVDRVDRVARVQPGVVNYELQKTAAEEGLFFPPNPGSWRSSTIGGNVATNASGPRSFRYGPTRLWVRSAEVVLGTGERLRVGSRAPKRSIGPDLLQMLVGSEGTLGILTEITVALAPLPARRSVLGVGLPEGMRLGRLVVGLAGSSTDGLTAVEFLDRVCADALARIPGSRLAGGSALLLLEIESLNEREEGERLERLHHRLGELGLVEDPAVFPDADQLWSLRGESGRALDREMGERVREDICVPISRLDELLAVVERIGRAAGVATCVYGHLGEANLHPNFAIDPTTPTAARLREELLRATVRLGGVISGEHGIGANKSAQLEEQIGPAGLRVLRSLKSACDPDGILNPGKVLVDLANAGDPPPSRSRADAPDDETPRE